MKRRILSPDLKTNFTYYQRYFFFRNNLYFNTHLFSTLNFFLITILASAILGLWVPIFWALTVTFTVYIFYAWNRTKGLALGLVVRRLHQKKGCEKEGFEIHYEISNETGFSLPTISFRQGFDGVQEGSFEVKHESAIPPQTRTRVTKKVTLDGGMGVKKLGDFTVLVNDELSLFPFRVEFSGTQEVEVYPFLEETPQLKKAISPDSTEFGFYDIQKRGESNLFIGTREYRYGDPVKHINWKLSRKTQKLILNEFEKNTNTYITLLLDLGLDSQVGFGSVSTWEAAKDLALSIAANEIRLRNYVQVLAQDLYLPFGTGEAQLMTLERHFTYHEMAKTGLTHLAYLQSLPSQSQIYFFCPLLATQNVRETLDVLKRLRVLGHKITVFGLDPFYEMKKSITNEAHIPVLMAGQLARKEFESIEKDLRKAGISFVSIDVGEDETLKTMLTTRARQHLEEKPS